MPILHGNKTVLKKKSLALYLRAHTHTQSDRYQIYFGAVMNHIGDRCCNEPNKMTRCLLLTILLLLLVGVAGELLMMRMMMPCHAFFGVLYLYSEILAHS